MSWTILFTRQHFLEDQEIRVLVRSDFAFDFAAVIREKRQVNGLSIRRPVCFLVDDRGNEG